MASTLTPQSPSSGGLAPAFSAADATGHTVVNSGRTLLWVKNGSAGSINVTVTTPGSVDGLALPDKVIAVPAGAERVIGKLAKNVYNDANGNVLVNYSAVASVTVAAIEP